MVRLMLVLGLVLSLAACGGSRTDGLSQAEEEALEARLEAAEAERAAAEADKVAAEADKVAAEADKVAAEADKVAAEADKAVAEADKAAAEADKAVAEADKDKAEADKAIAEADKAIAEAERDQAEADKVAAEADKDKAEAERDQAEADKVAAEADKDKAEADKAIAQAEVQHQLREAQAARQEAETARQEAETARGEADTARGEADTAREDAAAEQREKERLAAEAAEQQQAATRAEAALVLSGLSTATTSLVPSDVDANYRASATLAGATLTSTQGSSAGPRWYATTAQGRSGGNEDTLVVYTDVEAPESEPIRDHYPAFNMAYEISIVSLDHGDKVASSSFPSTSNTRIFALTRRMDDTAADAAPDLTAGISGRFDGASGTFTCTARTADGCTVFNSGATYTFNGDWTFKTSSNARVSVPDTNYTYFGWWRREDSTGAFSYNTFSMPGTAAVGSSFNTLTGSATYEGPAIGLYAIYQPLGAQSGHGEFKATARFSANFTANTLSGSVTGFDVNPDWSLTLGSTTMSGGDGRW